MTVSSVLLVDKRIQDYETVVGAIKPDDVRCIVFDVFDADTVCQEQPEVTSFQYILNKIAELNIGSFSNIGIVQHNKNTPFHQFFALSKGENSTVAAVETVDPTLETWSGFSGFITTLKTTYGVLNVDLMACALYSNPDWKYVIDTLAVNTGTTIRASTDDTGAAALGGDWFLESHTGVNLKDVYFTEAIENYNGLLMYVKSVEYRKSLPKAMSPGNILIFGRSGVAGSTNNTGVNLTSNDIISLYYTDFAFSALKTNGSVVSWGDTTAGGSGSITSGVVSICANYSSFAALKSDGSVIIWGDSRYGGTNNTNVDLSSGVVDLYSSVYTFFAIKTNGQLLTWGQSTTLPSSASSNVIKVFAPILSGSGRYSALKTDGTLIRWGDITTSVSNVVTVCANFSAFAALLTDGSVVTWGDAASGGNYSIASGVISICATQSAFAALNADGTITVWGNTLYGGSGKPSGGNWISIYSNRGAFMALNSSGQATAWGDSYYGSNGSFTTVYDIYPYERYDTYFGFYALKNNGSASATTYNGYVITEDYTNDDTIVGLRGARLPLTKSGKLLDHNSQVYSYRGNAFDLSKNIIDARGTVTSDVYAAHKRNIPQFNFLQKGSGTANLQYNQENICISSDGTVMALGLPRTDTDWTVDDNIGKIEVYSLSGSSWVRKGGDIMGSSTNLNTGGGSMSLSGNGNVIAFYTNTSAINWRGKVLVYEWSGSDWIRRGADLLSNVDYDYFGTSISLSYDGTVMAIGSRQKDTTNSNAGQTQIYTWSSNTWTQLGGSIDGKASGDYFGNSVSLSADGTIVAISGPYNDGSGNNCGHVRVFKYRANKLSAITNENDVSFGPIGWDRLGGDIYGLNANELSGYDVNSICLSSDGTTVAIGSASTSIGVGAWPSTTSSNCGTVRVYRYNASKTQPVSDSTSNNFGPAGWSRLGDDIVGVYNSEYFGTNVNISSDGNIVAISKKKGSSNYLSSSNCVRLFRYNSSKTSAQNNDCLSNYGPKGWDRIGEDINTNNVCKLSLSSNGSTLVVSSGDSACVYDVNTLSKGYDLSFSYYRDIDRYNILRDKINRRLSMLSLSNHNVFTLSQTYDLQYFNNYMPIKPLRILVPDFTSFCNKRIIRLPDATSSLSTATAIIDMNASMYNIYVINVTGALSDSQSVYGTDSYLYTSPFRVAAVHAGIATNGQTLDVYVQLIPGTSYTGSTRNGVTSLSYTLGSYNYIFLTPSQVNSVTIPTTPTNANFIIACDACEQIYINGSPYANYSGYVYKCEKNGTFTKTTELSINGNNYSLYGGDGIYSTGIALLSLVVPTFGTFTVPTKNFRDASFNLTPPTSDSSGAFSYTSSDTSVATVTTSGTVTIVGVGTTTITASQAMNGNYSSASVTALLVVNFGNTNTITQVVTDGAAVIPTPISNISTTYGSTWNQLSTDIVGKVTGDESGTSVSVSADGTIVAIGARSNTSNRGTVRVYKYNNTSWNQLGSDINGEASSDYSGQSVSLSANGQVVAIGANMNDGSGNLLPDSGHVRVYEFNGTNWIQRGGDIDGEANGDQSGISVSLSEDGNVIAIGATMNDGSGNALSNSGHVRVYKYNASKTAPQLTNQSLSTFGPAGWDRLGGDIDGEAVNDQSGFSVGISANGTIVAIGAIFNDATSGTNDTSDNRGHVRVYRYNASKTTPQLTNQSLATFGPVGWDRMGSDIDGEVAADQSGFSVSLSANGTSVAIGSPLYDAGGVTNSGRVRVFAWNGTSWAQRGQNINGVELNENIGNSVSLSADGTILSVASVSKVVNYNYITSTNTWNQIGSNVTGSITTLNVSYVLNYNPYVYLDAGNSSSYNGSTWTNLGSGGGNVNMTNMGTFDPNDNGGSFNFNGSSNYGLLTPAQRVLQNYTLIAVVKFTPSVNSASIMFAGRSNTDYTGIGYSYGNLTLSTYVSTSNSTNTTVTSSQWQVFVVTKNWSGATQFYRNGVATQYFVNSQNTNITATTISIGSTLTGESKWTGKISSLAIIDRVLTSTEVANISNFQNFQIYRVSLSSQGNILAVGAREYDGTTGTSTNIGVARVYRIDTSGNYTYSSNNTAIADVCGNIILPKSAGSTTIAFTQAASGATSSKSGTIPLTISQITPTIGTLSVPDKNYGDATFNLTAPTSDSAGAFTYTSSNTAVATVTTGGTVTIVGAGSTTITATQASSGNYTSGSISATLVVSPIAPTIGTFTISTKNFGDTSFNLTTPTSDSNGAFTYSIDASGAGVASVTSDGVVTIIGVGTATITATQEASGNFISGSVTGSLVVSASLSDFTIPAKNYGDASFNLTDPTSTDTSVGFTYTSSNTAVATLDGSGGRTVTIVGVGSTVITATQAATANRGELTITATLVVSPITPVITLAPITKYYGNPSFRLAPSTTNTDTSGGNVFTFSSSNIAVVSFLDNSLLRINGIGTSTISITQAASANFTDASGSVVITVNKGSSGFSASSFVVAANKTYGDASFAITTVPISSSTGAITYSSSNSAVATINNSGIITLVGQGTVTFTASQAESALYTADTKTSNTLTVARKTVELTRDTPSADTITKYYGNANFTVSATNESNGAISYASSDLSFATIDASSGEVTILGVGTTTITATRAQTAQYNSGTVSWTLQIARGTTTLSGLSSITRNVTVAPFSVSASSASNGTVSYSLQDPSSTVLTIHPTSGLVTLLSPGSSVIVASQTQGTLYEAPVDLTATVTVTAAANTLEGATLTGSNNFANVNLNDASLTNSNITNTNFSSGRLNNANLNGSTISSANMSSADLSGATIRNATVTSTDFTSANLRRTDMSGSSVRNSIFDSADLSGGILARIDASGASFVNANLRGANLSNADFTNANMTNANISDANLSNVSFTIPQKLQLLKNTENRARSEIQVSQTTGTNILSVVSNSAVRDVPNVANATFKVMAPNPTVVSGLNIIDISLDTANYAYFYFPINENELFRIEGVIYRINTSTSPPKVKTYETNTVVENTTYGVKAIRLLAGSLTIIVNSQNTLSSSSFVVPTFKQNTDAPFSPTTLPTSNSNAPIVYSSSNTNIATINSSSGLITIVSDACGFVRFTASQVATETHESASITSNELFVNRRIDMSLPGLNQTFSLSTFATLDASSINLDSTDATAVFYVRLSDMTDLFQYQTDSADINNVDASDIKYYVLHRKLPTGLQLNPSHAMMDKNESAGMLGLGEGFSSDKSLVKHDFIRYIAQRLFNTYHGVDLFQNETELQENITYLGETVRHNINNILSGISTTSASEAMSYDASGNKYLTNDSSGNTNLCREIMRQIAASEPSRFYNNGENTAGLKSVPLHENDSINFKLTITAASGQNTLTSVSVIPSRTYMIKMVLKNTVNTTTNANTPVSDSEMYPNSYPYSSSVVTYAPTSDSSGVYNVYSPPAPIPFSRFGYDGWYYSNTTTWVNVAQSIRARVKWTVPPTAAGSSTVADLQYIRMNLKVFNKTSLPFLVVYTQAGSYRKYTISAPNSLVNGSVYSFYANFGTYSREPATIGTTNAELTYSGVSSGAFANSEGITSIALESDNTAAAGSVEFTLSSIVVGEVGREKEYGFSADVPSAYP